MQAETAVVPDGFTMMDPYGPFHELCGPMYEKMRDGRMVVGMRAVEKHRNRGQIMHGGMIFTLLDNAMTHAGAQVRPEDSGLVTTSFSCELMSAVRIGDWIEAEIEILHAGRRVMFFNGLVRRDGPEGELVARGSATFQVLQLR